MQLIVILLIVYSIDFSSACSGYKAKIKNIENCAGNDQVISVNPNFSIELTENCELVPKGCITSKGFNTAKAKFSIKKDGIPLREGEGNLCEAADSLGDDAKNMMKIFALPDHCPIKAGKICVDGINKANLSKFKGLMSMAKGVIQIETNIEHDTGKSCLKVEIVISK